MRQEGYEDALVGIQEEISDEKGKRQSPYLEERLASSRMNETTILSFGFDAFLPQPQLAFRF